MLPPSKDKKSLARSKFLNTGTQDNEIIKLRDEKIERLEDMVKKLSMTACMQEKLNEWRSKYFTKILFRLKPSPNPLDEPCFNVIS
jgi:hypothetical protein